LKKLNILVRPVSRDDLAQLLELIEQLHDEASSAESAEVSEAARLAFESIVSQADRHLLVAEEAGRIVGSVDLLIVTNLSRHIRPWATIENLIVDSGHRKMGIATELMNRAEEIAREAGCYKVQLISNARRFSAHEFYEGLGFDAPVKGFRKYL
jgi:ribosomal protein S18 acetylase RimI-like enzyme